MMVKGIYRFNPLTTRGMFTKEKAPLNKGAVANLQSLDNRIGDVKFTKRFYVHLYSPIIILGELKKFILSFSMMPHKKEWCQMDYIKQGGCL